MMEEYVRFPPLPESDDPIRSMTVVPYLDDLYRSGTPTFDEPLYEEEERIVALTEGQTPVC